MINDQDLECKICKPATPDSYHVYSNDFWRVRHSCETDILGYCILESRRHFLDLSEAHKPELVDYGLFLGVIMKVQREILHCRRVYTISLAEAVPHFHVHVIPRSEDFSPVYTGRGIMSYPSDPACDSVHVENVVKIFQEYLARVLPKLSGLRN